MGQRWTEVLNTGEGVDHLDEEEPGAEREAGASMNVAAWSLVLLRRTA